MRKNKQTRTPQTCGRISSMRPEFETQTQTQMSKSATVQTLFSIIHYNSSSHLAFSLEQDIAVQFIQTILLASIQKRKRESMEIKTGQRKMFFPPFVRDYLLKGPFSSTFKTKRKDHHHTKSCVVCARNSGERPATPTRRCNNTRKSLSLYCMKFVFQRKYKRRRIVANISLKFAPTTVILFTLRLSIWRS